MSDLRAYLDERSMPEPNTGCVLWLGATANGYGRAKIGGRCFGVHRLSWEAANCRSVPDGLDVCHNCDVRSCVNPDHLFIGTRSENISDMWAKGRHPRCPVRGEDHRWARLTVEQVLEIRADNRSQEAIAAAYSVSQTQVSRIKRRESWGHV